MSIGNYISAIKANFVLYDLPFMVLNHPRDKYYLKSLKINSPMSVKLHNLIDITWLKAISQACSDITAGQVFRAIFLTGFCVFLRLSKILPHSLQAFDPSRHFTGKDVFLSKKFVKILIKCTKTMQTRDKIQVLTLPKLSDTIMCPFSALKSLFDLYPMSPHTSVFQIQTNLSLNPVTDSSVRKTLKAINVKLDLHGGSLRPMISEGPGPRVHLMCMSPFRI